MRPNNLIQLFLITLLCVTQQPASATYIIFDVGGVLLTHDTPTICLDLGFDLFNYLKDDHQNPFKLTDKLLTILNSFGEQKKIEAEGVATLQGHKIPQIMCDFFCGKISNRAILKKTFQRINAFGKEGKLVSDLEKKLLKKLAAALFEPTFLVNYFKPINATLEIIKKLAAKKDSKGNQQHTLVILSNWDKESFDQLTAQPKTKEIFSYFDKKNIIISAAVGIMKPHRIIFAKALSLLHTKPNDCIFIDDQEENIIAAQNCGLQTILIADKDGQILEQQLRAFGAL